MPQTDLAAVAEISELLAALPTIPFGAASGNFTQSIQGRSAGCAARTHGPQTSVGADPAAQPPFPSRGSSIRLVVSRPSVSVWIPKHENRAPTREEPRPAVE
jgi:hypothetical protein